jgi:isopropylmalate/homocitrate/citramalate synthase
MGFPERVEIVEVGPRDGLQNEPRPLPWKTKVELIERLGQAGLPVIEAGAFVSPKWVPQMADSEEVLRHLRRHEGVSYPVLVPNMKGLERAMAVDVQEIAIFGAASEASPRASSASRRSARLPAPPVSRSGAMSPACSAVPMRARWPRRPWPRWRAS